MTCLGHLRIRLETTTRISDFSLIPKNKFINLVEGDMLKELCGITKERVIKSSVLEYSAMSYKTNNLLIKHLHLHLHLDLYLDPLPQHIHCFLQIQPYLSLDLHVL